MAERKNVDYSASAVMLTNPPQLQDLLRRLYEAQGNANEIKDRIDASIPKDLIIANENIQAFIASLNEEIRDAIDTYGSYQDVTNGMYAVKQRKVSISYDAARFKFLYPQYAPAIIIESVDTAKLKGLIKGGLLKEEDLKHPDVAIAKETESFAYIVKV